MELVKLVSRDLVWFRESYPKVDLTITDTFLFLCDLKTFPIVKPNSSY